MQLSNIWHCPRPALAQSFLKLLGSGLVTSTSLFAPRRTGKTVFLRQDLAPAARAEGYEVAYVDLWQTKANPGIAIIRGLEEALEPKGMAQRAMQVLRSPVKKLKASASVNDVKGEVEVELTDSKAKATEMALRIEELVAAIVQRKPLLLLVDEAQELARTKENELMATALRTAITKHRDRIRVVFTGSSRSQLAHVFSSADAPLYAVGATVQDFPLLGREFVEFVAHKYAATNGRRRLNVDNAWELFRDLFKQMPEPFLSAVVTMLMEPSMTLEAACERQMAEDASLDNHEATWESLDPLQKEIVQLVRAEPTVAIFAKGTREALAKLVGKPALAASTVQYAVGVLASRNIVVQSARGTFEFDNPAFAQLLKTRNVLLEAPRKRAPRR